MFHFTQQKIVETPASAVWQYVSQTTYFFLITPGVSQDNLAVIIPTWLRKITSFTAEFVFVAKQTFVLHP